MLAEAGSVVIGVVSGVVAGVVAGVVPTGALEPAGALVPGVVDASTIARLVEAIGAPVNIMASYGAPSVAELADLGVARVSVGPAITRAAMATIRTAARELLETGTYGQPCGRGSIRRSERPLQVTASGVTTLTATARTLT